MLFRPCIVWGIRSELKKQTLCRVAHVFVEAINTLRQWDAILREWYVAVHFQIMPIWSMYFHVLPDQGLAWFARFSVLLSSFCYFIGSDVYTKSVSEFILSPSLAEPVGLPSSVCVADLCWLYINGRFGCVQRFCEYDNYGFLNGWKSNKNA